jgi:hypothetical protein
MHHRDINVIQGRLAFDYFKIVPDEKTVERRPLNEA